MAKVYRLIREPDANGKERWVRRMDSGAGTWFLDYVDASGKRHRDATDATTKTEALTLLRSKLSDNVKAEILGVPSTDAVSITLEKFLDEQYIPHVKATRREGTWGNYEAYAKEIIPRMGKMPLRSIGRVEIQKFMEDLIRTGKTPRNKPLSKATINRKVGFLRSVFYEALRRDLVDRNPCARIKLLHEENTRTRIMTEKEEEKIHEQAPDWLRPVLKIATLAGLRQGEILALRWEDIDSDRKLIFVSHQSKNHKRREIPLLGELERVLGALSPFVGPNGASPHLFTDPVTCEAYKTHDVVNHFKASARRAKIRDLRFHDLRRTFASRLAQRGVPLQTIAKLLGHGATYVTERYAHLSCDDLREAMNRLKKPAPAQEVGRNPAESPTPLVANR
jgi:integrase